MSKGVQIRYGIGMVACVLGTAIPVVAQSSSSAQQQAADDGKLSFLELLIGGGPVMIILGFCSVLALTIFFERMVALRRSVIVPKKFAEAVSTELGGEPRAACERARKCAGSESVLGKVIISGLEKYAEEQTGPDRLEKILEDHAARAVRKLRRSLLSLKVIATITPLLGLLGTVYGMITTFQTVATSAAGFGKVSQLSEGIYEALVTTASGLTIAVPVLVMHFFLLRKIDGYADDIEETCEETIENLYSQEKADQEVRGATA